jgi:hypothetical protein
MKQRFAVIALVCLLSVPTLAGEIPTMGAPEPPPQTSLPPAVNVPGEIPTDGSPGDIPSGGFVGEIASDGLAAILSVLGSFV